MKRVPVLAAAAIMTILSGAGLPAQKLAPEELAGRLSGTWVLNRELSSGFRAPGRRGGPSTTLAPRYVSSADSAPQRGRGGSGGGRDNTPTDPSDLTPEQRAQQAAMRQLQQIADWVTVAASVGSVTFTDARGERTFAINDKTAKIDVGGAPVNVKSKWDRNVLRQEFSNPQAKLVETWGLDEAGRLVLTARLESMTLMTPDEKAFFDRQ